MGAAPLVVAEKNDRLFLFDPIVHRLPDEIWEPMCIGSFTDKPECTPGGWEQRYHAFVQDDAR